MPTPERRPLVTHIFWPLISQRPSSPLTADVLIPRRRSQARARKARTPRGSLPSPCAAAYSSGIVTRNSPRSFICSTTGCGTRPRGRRGRPGEDLLVDELPDHREDGLLLVSR